mgnify:FL=1
METRLYNFFLAERKASAMSLQGQTDKSLFVVDGYIDMPRLMEHFAMHMKMTFDMDGDHKFLENNGR